MLIGSDPGRFFESETRLTFLDRKIPSQNKSSIEATRCSSALEVAGTTSGFRTLSSSVKQKTPFSSRQFSSIKCKHNDRWQHLSLMKKCLVLFREVDNAVSYHLGPVAPLPSNEAILVECSISSFFSLSFAFLPKTDYFFLFPEFKRVI